MEKIQIYRRKEELDPLREAAARSGRSVAIEHDSIHDEP
jgi:hypothetical protein